MDVSFVASKTQNRKQPRHGGHKTVRGPDRPDPNSFIGIDASNVAGQGRVYG